ncbi:MAG: Flp family type IVb pilin [Acidimicrobiales bacterium]
MPALHRWFTRRLTALRDHASRGATLVEYALITALLVVVSIAALEFLTNTADGEINNQAQCVSDRPPPTGDAGCGFAPVPDDVTTPDPNIAPPTTGAPVDDPDTYTIEAATAFEDGPGWTVVLPVTVLVEVQEPPTDPTGAPGIRVRARIQMRDPNNPPNNLPDPGFTECITNAVGQCELRYTVPFDDVQEMTMLVIGVDAPGAPSDFPPMITRTRPVGP